MIRVMENNYDDYNRDSYEQYKKSLGDNYADDEYYDSDDYYYSDDYNRYSYEQYKKSLEDNYADDEYYDSDDDYYSETYDFTVRLPY